MSKFSDESKALKLPNGDIIVLPSEHEIQRMKFVSQASDFTITKKANKDSQPQK